MRSDLEDVNVKERASAHIRMSVIQQKRNYSQYLHHTLTHSLNQN